MPIPPDTPKRERSPLVIAIGLILSPALYVLSIGPAVSLMWRGYLSKQTFGRIYAPLNYLRDNFEPIGDTLRWYCSLWP